MSPTRQAAAIVSCPPPPSVERAIWQVALRRQQLDKMLMFRERKRERERERESRRKTDGPRAKEVREQQQMATAYCLESIEASRKRRSRASGARRQSSTASNASLEEKVVVGVVAVVVVGKTEEIENEVTK
jgi:hypothetical protein